MLARRKLKANESDVMSKKVGGHSNRDVSLRILFMVFRVFSGYFCVCMLFVLKILGYHFQWYLLRMNYCLFN